MHFIQIKMRLNKNYLSNLNIKNKKQRSLLSNAIFPLLSSLMFVFAGTNLSFSSNIEHDEKEALLDYGKLIKEKIFEISTNQNFSRNEKIDKMAKFVIQEMDTDYISKKVIGSYIKKLTEEQKRGYFNQFNNFLLNQIKDNASDIVFEPSKNVKLRKSVVKLSNNFYDIPFDIVTKENPFRFTVSVRSYDLKKFKIVNLAVDAIDIAGTQNMLFKTHLDQYGTSAIFELMND